MSGVRTSASAPWAWAASSTLRRSPPPSAALTAASDASRTTVRIVPSTGRITAWYAASDAAASAAAALAPSMPSASATTLDTPRRICDRITPELPRAPMSDPWLMALHTAARSGPALASSSQTARSVRAMFVPVSPSGTG